MKHTPITVLLALSDCGFAGQAIAASSGVAKLHINLRASADLSGHTQIVDRDIARQKQGRA